MIADLLVADLPGELEDREVWEDELLDICPVCEAECSPEASGLCHRCHDRFRGAGGCGTGDGCARRPPY